MTFFIGINQLHLNTNEKQRSAHVNFFPIEMQEKVEGIKEKKELMKWKYPFNQYSKNEINNQSVIHSLCP